MVLRQDIHNQTHISTHIPMNMGILTMRADMHTLTA